MRGSLLFATTTSAVIMAGVFEQRTPIISPNTLIFLEGLLTRGSKQAEHSQIQTSSGVTQPAPEHIGRDKVQ